MHRLLRHAHRAADVYDFIVLHRNAESQLSRPHVEKARMKALPSKWFWDSAMSKIRCIDDMFPHWRLPGHTVYSTQTLVGVLIHPKSRLSVPHIPAAGVRLLESIYLRTYPLKVIADSVGLEVPPTFFDPIVTTARFGWRAIQEAISNHTFLRAIQRTCLWLFEGDNNWRDIPPRAIELKSMFEPSLLAR